MAKHISIAGKGGTGKTTLAALLIRYLLEKNKKPVLAVDADPNANLYEALGLERGGSVSEIIKNTKDINAVPQGMTKDVYIDYHLQRALSEGKGLDLLTLGGPEGAGCYCFPNQLLSHFMGQLSDNYPYMLIDNEAGMEHLSRRIAQSVDLLLIVSDSTVRGVRSAGRIAALTQSLDLKIKNSYLVLNRSKNGADAKLQEEIEKTKLHLIGSIPEDPRVFDYDASGRPLFELPLVSPSTKAAFNIGDQLEI